MRRYILPILALLMVGCAGSSPAVIAPTPAPTTPAPTALPTQTAKPTSTSIATLEPSTTPTISPTAEPLPTVFIPTGNPTVPPDAGGTEQLALSDIPLLPDALTITPGDRFSVQTTPSSPEEVEDFYTRALAEFGLTLTDREEGVTSLFGLGLYLHFGASSNHIYVLIMPSFEGEATGVLLTLDEFVVRPPP